MIIEGFETEKIKASIGETIKVKALNKYRMARLLGIARQKSDGALLVKCRITDLPWSAPISEIDYHYIKNVRKADKNKWLAA